MERKTFFNKKSGNVNNRPETFALTVTGYDLAAKPPVVLGTRLDNGAEVSVSLRAIDYVAKGKFKRSEITDFAAPRKTNQHPGTVPGGILLVQEAFQNEEGKFAARWIQSLSHTPGEAEVFITTAHVGPVKQGRKTQEHPEGRPYSLMTFLMDGDFNHLSQEMADAIKLAPPFKVDSVADLRQVIGEMLKENLGVGVRVSQGDGFDAMYVGRKRDVSIEQTVETFLKDVEPIAADIDAGNALCEVIPYANVFAGPATVDIMGKNEVVKSRLKQFNGEGGNGDGRSYPISVFRPAIVAVRFSEAGADGQKGVFFSHFEPIYTRQPVHGLVSALCHAKTEHLAPEPPVLNSRSANGNQEAPETEPGSFDGAPADDDLVAAAGAVGAPADDIGYDIPASQPESQPPARRGRYARG